MYVFYSYVITYFLIEAKYLTTSLKKMTKLLFVNVKSAQLIILSRQSQSVQYVYDSMIPTKQMQR